MCDLTDVQDIRNELRLTCSAAVNRRLIELNGIENLNSTTEAALLALIKEIAVMSVHHQVHRQRFCQMIQAEGERIGQFMAKIKAQADLCNFKVKCTGPDCAHEVSYRDDMIVSQTINGLSNPTYQSKILEEAPQYNDVVKEMYTKLVGMEATQKSSNHIQSSKAAAATSPNTNSEANAVKSEYKRSKNPPATKNTNQNQTNCRFCGRSSHPEGKTMSREDCPASKMKCKNCRKIGHFEKVCEKKRRNQSNAAATEGTETAEEAATYQNSVTFALACETDQDFRPTRRHHPEK